MKKEVISVIPYFGGISQFSPDHTQQALDLRHKWFEYCLQSLKSFTHTFYIYLFPNIKIICSNITKNDINGFYGVEHKEIIPIGEELIISLFTPGT